MPNRDLVVVGASAGGVEELRELIGALPVDLPATIELAAAGRSHYRCRVGHAWSPQSLLDQQHLALEAALWTAMRTMEDKAALQDRMAEESGGGRRPLAAERFRSAAQDARESARLIRRFLDELPENRRSLAHDEEASG